MIVENKKVKISKKIDECGSDSKKLLPTSNTDKQPVDEFADFFISKILKKGMY